MLSQFYSAVEKDLCTISPSTICRERLASSFTDRPNKAYKPVAVNGDHISIYSKGDPFNTQSPQQASQHHNSQSHQHGGTSTQTHNQYNTSHRHMAANQFQYPIGNEPVSVNQYGLSKSGKNWPDLVLKSENDTQQFYNILQGRLSTFNIHLLEYDQISTSTGIFAINNFNCTNYDTAFKEMNNALYIFLDSHKDTIFELHPEAIHYIESYRLGCDGQGFLLNLIEDNHPTLKKNRVDDDDTQPTPPQFHDFKTIYEFVNGYIRWLQNEKLRGRTSSDKEKIDHIRNSLDDRFDTAKEKIKRQLEQVYANPMHLSPFPTNLKLTPQLAVNIVKLMPKEQRANLTNETAHINKLNDLIHETLTMEKGTLHSLDKKKNGNTRWKNRKKKTWAANIEWKILKGEIYPACNGSNHNVYSTGCPEMARFCACQKFYETADKDKLEEVLKSYKKYQHERMKMQQERQKKDKLMLTALAQEDYDSDDMARLKKSYFNAYKNDFEEEQYRINNPYDSDEHTESGIIEEEDV